MGWREGARVTGWLAIAACHDDPTEPADSAPAEVGSGDSGIEDSGDAPFSCADAPAPPDLPDDAWTLADPAPAGDVLQLVPAPSDPSIVYATSSFNGFFRSDDGGVTWRGMDTEVKHLMGQTAVDPDDADVVYVTMGLVYRSTDGGSSFQGTGFGDVFDESGRVYGLLVRDGVLYAVTGDSTVYASHDQGGSFAPIGLVDPAFQGPRPPDEGHEDMGGFGIGDAYWYLAEAGGVLYAVHHEGSLYRSEDLGASWALVAEGAFHASSLGADEDLVWAGGGGALVLYREGGASFATYDTDHVHLRAMTRTASGTLLATDDATVYTVGDDGSLTALATPEGGLNLMIAASTMEAVLIGHQYGIFRSADDGASWTAVDEGLDDNDLGPILAHPQCPERLWVGTLCEGGLFASDDYGTALRDMDVYMHYVMVPRIAPSDPETLWVSTDDRVAWSRDLGETWTDASGDTIAFHAHGLAVHPEDPGTALVGSVGSGEIADDFAHVYRTDDWGETWTDVSEGLPETGTSYHAIHYVADDPDVVLLGTYRAGDTVHTSPDPGIGMFRSTDGAATWSPVDLEGQIGEAVGNVPILDECDARLYAATDGGLLLSVDQGATWTLSLPTETEILSVACRGDLLLAVGYDGVYRSDDAGESWTDWAEGVAPGGWTYPFMPQVEIDADATVGYLTIMGEGLYRRAL